jgi:hypothetical protein
MNASPSLSTLLLDEAVGLIRQGMAPLEACRQVGLSFHLYGFLVEARPALARELDQLRQERDRARSRAYKERMRLAKPPLRLLALPVSTGAAYCGQCGGPAALVGSGGAVRCAECGDSAAASGALAYCTLDGERMAGHDRCHSCSQLVGQAHHHPAGVCLPREMRLARVATR